MIICTYILLSHVYMYVICGQNDRRRSSVPFNFLLIPTLSHTGPSRNPTSAVAINQEIWVFGIQSSKASNFNGSGSFDWSSPNIIQGDSSSALSPPVFRLNFAYYIQILIFGIFECNVRADKISNTQILHYI